MCLADSGGSRIYWSKKSARDCLLYQFAAAAAAARSHLFTATAAMATAAAAVVVVYDLMLAGHRFAGAQYRLCFRAKNCARAAIDGV